jgi:glutamate 5-kinase
VSRPVVVKIGTSSLTDDEGAILPAAVAKLCDEVAVLRAEGRPVVVVTSAAIAAGLPELGLGGAARPRDPVTLQAVSAIGQVNLMATYKAELARHGLVCGQVLLSPLDFLVRTQYLHARGTLTRLLELGVVPVVNENDAIADDEIRFGDNDRLAALVAHLVEAEILVLLTDAAGVFTADPRRDGSASLIEEIVEIDHELETVAGGAGTARGSGGMASKLAAAKIATWSGLPAVIAGAARPNVLPDAVAGVPGVGTVFRPRPTRLSARKLWIAFAVGANGRVTVDAGARAALEARSVSLLPAGVTAVAGEFAAGDAVELVDPAGTVFAKGPVRYGVTDLATSAGLRTAELRPDLPAEVIHRDDLVLLP